MGSRSRSPEPCAQHVHGLQGSSCWILSCLILSRVEASTKPGVIQFRGVARLRYASACSPPCTATVQLPALTPRLSALSISCLLPLPLRLLARTPSAAPD